MRDLTAAIVRISEGVDRLTFLVEKIAASSLDRPTRVEELLG